MLREEKPISAPPLRLQFGPFEADLASAELRKDGIRLHLQEQPFQILSILLERPGELVTRDQIRERLWSGDTFVDFDHSLNVAINKLREALGDSASQPRFIETVPRRGYRFLGDVAVAAPDPPAPSAPHLPGHPAGHHLARNGKAILIFAALTVAAVAGVFLLRDRNNPVLTAIPLSAEPGQEQEPTLSPDGAHVAYVADPDGQLNYDIYVRSIAGGAPRRLTSTPSVERNPIWSPDGGTIAFLRHDRGDSARIVLVPALGGPERTLAGIPTTGGIFSQLHRLLSWFPEGKRLIVTTARNNRSTLSLLFVDSGRQAPFPDPPPALNDADPAVSPDGRRLVFARFGARGSNLFLQDLNEEGLPTGTPRPLTDDERQNSFPAWTPGGDEILFASGAIHFRQLFRIPASGGSPRQLPVSGGFHSAWPALAGKRLVYHTGHYDVNLWRTPLANHKATGPSERFASSTFIEQMPEFSPDGRHIAFASNRSGFQNLWRVGANGEDALQLTNFRGPEVTRPVWSPAGDRIGFAAGGESFDVSAEGGPTRLVFRDRGGVSWSNDASYSLITDRNSGSRVARMALRNGVAEGPPVPLSPQRGFGPRLSSDGRWIYFTRGAEPSIIYRVAATGGPEQLVQSTANSATWTLGKNGLWFLSPASNDGKATLEFQPFDAGRSATVAPILRRPMWGLTVCPDASCAIHAQADRFESDLMLVDNFR